MTRLLDEGKLDEDHYRRARIHIIENDMALAPLGASSKMDAEWAFLTHLRDLGRETAAARLDRHHDDLGKRGTVDLRAVFQGIGPEHQGKDIRGRGWRATAGIFPASADVDAE